MISEYKTELNGILFNVNDVKKFDKILGKCNYVWIIQILIAWLYCIKIGRFVPVQPNAKISIFIKQFYVCLFTNSFIYFLDMFLAN